jgi:hypothetical protein
MKKLMLLGLLGAALTALPAVTASAAQVGVGIQVGPSYVGPAPVCPYGYYDYYPYTCAPYGFYGPEWFSGGVFIGAGPWYHGGIRGYYGHGWHGSGYYGHGGYYGHEGFRGGTVARGPMAHQFHGNAAHGGPAPSGFHGGGGAHGGGFHGGEHHR